MEYNFFWEPQAVSALGKCACTICGWG